MYPETIYDTIDAADELNEGDEVVELNYSTVKEEWVAERRETVANVHVGITPHVDVEGDGSQLRTDYIPQDGKEIGIVEKDN